MNNTIVIGITMTLACVIVINVENANAQVSNVRPFAPAEFKQAFYENSTFRKVIEKSSQLDINMINACGGIVDSTNNDKQKHIQLQPYMKLNVIHALKICDHDVLYYK